MKREPLLDLHRRWRLRSAGPNAYWGIFTFSPSESNEESAFQLELHRLEELLSKQCLFLLGRPGAGKTAEFESHFSDGMLLAETVISLEARQLDGAGADSIFLGAQWREALDAGKPIRLVLDSVDEALLGRGTFMDGLQYQLGLAKAAAAKQNLPLSVILTCRLSEWNEGVATQIAGLWSVPADDCTYELAPLSHAAAMELAAEHGVTEARQFAATVSSAGMEAYACWPRTLIWLAKEFARDSVISSTLTALHEKRCSRQFETDRLERYGGQLTIEKLDRMAKAVEFLATVAIATGTQRFVIGRPAGERELDISELARVIAKLPDAAKTYDFVEALKYGDLFERVGDSWVFQEQSDAEFLAASHLARLPVEQMAGFFGTETANGWEVFPQLHATAAMAAVHHAEFRQWLLKHDPLVLLRTDFAALTAGDKQTAITAFLNLIEAGKAADADEQPSHLQTLAHDQLAEQLRPWLHDRKRNLAAREMALRIAAACASEKLRLELGDDIWKLATSSEANDLSWLSLAISTIGVSWPKERLIAIITGAAAPGRYWASKGAALYALFNRKRQQLPKSEHAKLSEIIGHLKLNPTGVSSSYDSFVRSSHEHLEVDDVNEVCVILEGLKQWVAPLDSITPIYKLALAALHAASSLLPDEGVTAAFAGWWYWAIHQDDSQIPGQDNTCSLAEIGLDKKQKRQVLLAAMLRHSAAEKLTEFQIYELPCEAGDYPWLLARLPSTNGVEEKIVANLIACRIHNRLLREDNLPALQKAYAASAQLRTMLPSAPDGDIHGKLIRLSEEQERRSAEEQAKRKNRVRERQKYDAEKEFADALDGCRKGDEQWWPWLLEGIECLGKRSSGSNLWEVGSPQDLPAWERIAAADMPAVRQAARGYLLRHPPKLPARNESHLGIEATKHALMLLREDLLSDAELSAGFRSEWVDVILRSLYPDRPPLPEMLAVLKKLNTSTTIDCIRTQLDFDWSENRYLLANYLDAIWSADIQAFFQDVLSRSPIQPESYRTGITYLSQHDREAAAILAMRRCDEFAGGLSCDCNSRQVAIGTALLAFPEHWQRVWPLIAGNAEEGLKSLVWVASASERLEWREAIFAKKEQYAELIATLYGWLHKHLPSEPLHRGSYTPGGIDYCRDIQRECHEALVQMGRSDLLRKAFVFAGKAKHPWTERAARKSERNALAHRWQPWPLVDLAEWLATDGGARITDCDALLRAVEASLGRFGEFYKQMPQARLWDFSEKTPKREKELSDELAVYLKQDLPNHVVPRNTALFINREPQFFSNERTDIHLQAALSDGSRYTIIIEVKLCDNRDVKDSMKTQLAQRYLLEKGLTHGIYFVGWFACASWPKKKTSFQNRGLVKAGRFLEKQAATLSKDGLRIRAVLAPCPPPAILSNKKNRSSKSAAAASGRTA